MIYYRILLCLPSSPYACLIEDSKNSNKLLETLIVTMFSNILFPSCFKHCHPISEIPRVALSAKGNNA